MTQKYVRYEVITLADALKEIKNCLREPRRKIQFTSGRWVTVTSTRLRTFERAHRKNGEIRCISCGIIGSLFAVESSAGQNSPHLNLYGIKDNEEILFTHDHILARSLGGADNLSNTQVMCSPCNSKKGKAEGKEAERRKAEKVKKQYGVPYGNNS